MSAGIGRTDATAQTLIAQSVAAMEHVRCAKVTIDFQPECTKHPMLDQLSAVHELLLETKPNPGLPTEARGGMVEMGGIEPPSNSRPRILLRAQSTV